MSDVFVATESLPAVEDPVPSPIPMLAPELERARLLRERDGARAQAQVMARANRQLEAFLGIASHELRGPVTSSSLSVQMVARRLDVLRYQEARQDAWLAGQLAALQDMLTTAESSLARLTRLVSDLVDISRLQSGQLALQPAHVDLLALVRAAVDEQRQLAPSRRLRLHLPALNAVPVWADADRIHQVVTNLLTNALKYAPADRPVEVRVQIRAGWARVGVRDQGPGLSAAAQARIWEPFYRADGVEVSRGDAPGVAQSLGLGLNICKTIIEQHQGRIGVRSTPGQGACFWFALPVMPWSRLEEDEPPRAASDAA